MDTDNDRPTLARVYRSLRDICPDSWNLPGGRMPTGLGYDFLRPVEDSGINDLKHYYFMADLADGQPLGRANLYSVCFDLATTDRKLTPAWRTTIKRWFPGFMTFRFLECGLLTMVSNPLALRSDTDLERVLPVLAGQMDQLAHDDGSDFLMIRDVDPEHYQRYLDILRPLGFRPALGFSRVDTTISWSSVEEALGCYVGGKKLDALDEEGFCDTHDLGFLVDDEIVILGRQDEVFIVHGENRFPYDIEFIIRGESEQHRTKVACFGVNERVVVVLESPLHSIIDKAEADRLRCQVVAATGLQLDELITVRRGAIPTTTSGKLKRRAVAQAYRDGTLPRLATHAWTADPDSAPKTTRSSLEGAH